MFTCCRGKLVSRCVDPKIDDLESGSLKHHSDQILSYIVHIPLNSSQDYFAQTDIVGVDHVRSQNCEPGFHGFCGKHHLGYKIFTSGEFITHNVHPGYQCLTENVIDFDFLFEGRFDQFLYAGLTIQFRRIFGLRVDMSLYNAFPYGFQCIHR